MSWELEILFIYYLHAYGTNTYRLIACIYALQDGYELKMQFPAQLLTYKENKCEENMPAGVRDFLNCINATQS
jgi:hypothetical protein